MMHQSDDTSQDEASDIGALYQRHARTVLRYLNAHLTLKEDAEDLLIEVFLASLKNPTVQKLEPSEQLAWLYRVARNKLADHYRVKSSLPGKKTVDNDLSELLMDEDIYCLPEQAIMLSEDHARLMAYIRTLPPLHQEILQLRFAYGLHSGEIGERLHKNAVAVRVILSRILNKLRLYYQKQEECF